MKIFKCLLLFSALVLAASCESDDVDEAPDREIVITTLDLTTAIVDNLPNDTVIGNVKGRTNNGQVKFEIASQTPEGALLIDEISGELIVADESLINAETSPEINMVVTITNGSVSKMSNVLIQVNAAPVDFDGDGVFSDTDPDDNSPCVPAQNPGYIDYDATNSVWMAADCDGDGISNTDEVSGGKDPYVDNSVSCESTVNTGIWEGIVNIEYTGDFAFVDESNFPAVSGCGTLVLTDLYNFDCPDDKMLFTFTPAFDGATTGTVVSEEMFYECTGSTISATGTYDEVQQVINATIQEGGFDPLDIIITPSN